MNILKDEVSEYDFIMVLENVLKSERQLFFSDLTPNEVLIIVIILRISKSRQENAKRQIIIEYCEKLAKDHSMIGVSKQSLESVILSF